MKSYFKIALLTLLCLSSVYSRRLKKTHSLRNKMKDIPNWELVKEKYFPIAMISDVHGSFLPSSSFDNKLDLDENKYSDEKYDKEVENEAKGGMKNLIAHLNILKKDFPDLIFAVAGDETQGTYYSEELYKAPIEGKTYYSPIQAIVEDLELTDRTVRVAGNHEFDFKAEFMKNVVEEAKTSKGESQFINANVNSPKYFGKELKPYKIFKVGGKNIAFIGLTAVNTPNQGPMPLYKDPNDGENPGAEFNSYYTSITKTIKELEKNEKIDELEKNEKIDRYILIAHEGCTCRNEKTGDKERKVHRGNFEQSLEDYTAEDFSQSFQEANKISKIRNGSEDEPVCSFSNDDDTSDENLVSLLDFYREKKLKFPFDAIIAGHTHKILHHFVYLPEEEGSDKNLKKVPIVSAGRDLKNMGVIYLKKDKTNNDGNPDALIEGPVPLDFSKDAKYHGIDLNPKFQDNGKAIKVWNQMKVLSKGYLQELAKVKKYIENKDTRDLGMRYVNKKIAAKMLELAQKQAKNNYVPVILLNSVSFKGDTFKSDTEFSPKILRSAFTPTYYPLYSMKVTGYELRDIVKILSKADGLYWAGITTKTPVVAKVLYKKDIGAKLYNGEKYEIDVKKNYEVISLSFCIPNFRGICYPILTDFRYHYPKSLLLETLQVQPYAFNVNEKKLADSRTLLEYIFCQKKDGMCEIPKKIETEYEKRKEKMVNKLNEFTKTLDDYDKLNAIPESELEDSNEIKTEKRRRRR